MKLERLLLVGISFGGLLLVPGFAGAAETSPEALLARVRARQAKLESLRAGLEQVKSYPQLGIEDPPETGRFFLARGRGGTRVRIDIEKPERRILTVKDGRYVLYQPRIRQAIEGRVGGSGAKGLFSGLLAGSPDAMAELDADYAVEGLGVEPAAGRSLQRLKFTARPGAAVYCREIELSVDVALDLPVRQSCREANDSVVTLTLSGVELDVSIDDSLFELDLPPGTERVKGGS